MTFFNYDANVFWVEQAERNFINGCVCMTTSVNDLEAPNPTSTPLYFACSEKLN